MGFLASIFVPTGNRRLNELTGFLMCVSALLLFLALISYSPLDPSLNSASVLTGAHAARNWIGVVGASISDLVLQFFGIGAFLLPVVPLAADSISNRQEPRWTLAAHVRSRVSGAAAGTPALAAGDSAGRLAGPRTRRLHDPLRQPGGRLHSVRHGARGCALSFDGVFVLFAADVGSHAVRLCYSSVESVPRLAARTRQAKAAEGTRPAANFETNREDATDSIAACGSGPNTCDRRRPSHRH